MRYFKASPCHQYFTDFFFPPLVVKNRWKGICDVTCINVGLPSLICLLFLSVTSIHSFCLCFSLHAWSSCFFPIWPSLPFQHIKEPWLGQCTGRPLVSFALGPNKECPLSFSVTPFEVLSSTCKWGRAGWLWSWWHGPLLCCAGCTSHRYSWKCAHGAAVFVHSGLCISVGVLIHGSTYLAG